MRYRPLSSPTRRVEPLSQERRQENRELRATLPSALAELRAADRADREQRAAERLAELGSVRDLSPRDYRLAKAELRKILRSAR